MSIIIGIDPDSDKYGVAGYTHGKLTTLVNFSIVDMSLFLKNEESVDLYVVEDVLKNNFIYDRYNGKSTVVLRNVARSVGRCQQAQKHLVDFLRYYERPFKLVPPQKGNWADRNKYKNKFERMTGWTGKSNIDTRSAAYFGYLFKDYIPRSKR